MPDSFDSWISAKKQWQSPSMWYLFITVFYFSLLTLKCPLCLLLHSGDALFLRADETWNWQLVSMMFAGYQGHQHWLLIFAWGASLKNWVTKSFLDLPSMLTVWWSPDDRSALGLQIIGAFLICMLLIWEDNGVGSRQTAAGENWQQKRIVEWFSLWCEKWTLPPGQTAATLKQSNFYFRWQESLLLEVLF